MNQIKSYIKRLLGVASPEAQPRNKALWSIGVFGGESPLRLRADKALAAPAITRDDLTDISAAFIADPFLARSDDGWYLFFEALNRANDRGEIGVATSRDLASWKYE